MEQAKQRMMEGNLFKARSGRVTARVPAYGYKLVDAQGNEGPNARKETYYAIRDNESVIVRRIYERFLSGDSMRRIALDLEMEGINPPKQYKHWEYVQIRLILINEVYQGDFYAHRWLHTVVQKPSNDGLSTRQVKCKVERPRDEWIHIPVPAIISREDWAAANALLAKNKKTCVVMRRSRIC
ncbi:MAG: recombinase family protein [Chloroflexi bacterium]|nr:recombinase family protein [Chloroflexota bacterium]